MKWKGKYPCRDSNSGTRFRKPSRAVLRRPSPSATVRRPRLAHHIPDSGELQRPPIDISRHFPYQIVGTLIDGASAVGWTLTRSPDAVNVRKLLEIRLSLAMSAPQCLEPCVCWQFRSGIPPPGTQLALGYLSSPLMTPGMLATLVVDGARRYASTLVGTAPEAPPPLRAETPAAGRGAPAELRS